MQTQSRYEGKIVQIHVNPEKEHKHNNQTFPIELGGQVKFYLRFLLCQRESGSFNMALHSEALECNLVLLCFYLGNCMVLFDEGNHFAKIRLLIGWCI